jgi:hypothetical protein
MCSNVVRLVIALLPLFASASASGALIGRLPFTDEVPFRAYFDSERDLTWALPFPHDEASMSVFEVASAFTLGDVDSWELAGTDLLRHMRNVNQVRPDAANVFVRRCVFPNLNVCLPAFGLFYTPEVYVDTDGTTVFGEYPLRYNFQNDTNFLFGSGSYGVWLVTQGDPFGTTSKVPASNGYLLEAALLLAAGTWLRRRFSRS